MENKSDSLRIVILGAGFAGIYAYLQLHKLFHKNPNKHIVLISEYDYFTFTPMIHEVATGTLLPFSITQSLRALPPCCLNRFVEGSVLNVNADTKEVLVRHINPEAPLSGTGVRTSLEERITFDYCIVAMGSDTNYFGVSGAKEYALTLKNLEDARRVKNRIIESFEQAQITKDEAEKRRLLRFVIVGGGATGIELAGEMSDLIYGELRKAFPLLYPLVEIRLYESATCFLSGIDEWMGTHTHELLAGRKRIQMYCGKRVTKLTRDGIYLGDEYVSTGTVVWTAGVKAKNSSIHAKKKIEKDQKSGRIKVNTFLQIPTYPFLFVVGDQAWVCNKEAGQPYPMRAQFAVREGETAAENIKHMENKTELKEFHWKDMGFIVSLGKGNALAYIFGMQLSGPLAWVIYRMAYLLKIVGIRAKLRTALEWTLNTFLPRDISKL
jgi:NADH:ubiquinone reductase (H+-translocating)